MNQFRKLADEKPTNDSLSVCKGLNGDLFILKYKEIDGVKWFDAPAIFDCDNAFEAVGDDCYIKEWRYYE